MWALDGHQVVTSGDTAVGLLIDHIAIGAGLSASEVQVWSNVVDGTRLSDHAGVMADIEVRSR
jgi:endonuclease/exonuclease/phosphatase family metal-dependent hydrolase